MTSHYTDKRFDTVFPPVLPELYFQVNCFRTNRMGRKIAVQAFSASQALEISKSLVVWDKTPVHEISKHQAMCECDYYVAAHQGYLKGE